MARQKLLQIGTFLSFLVFIPSCALSPGALAALQSMQAAGASQSAQRGFVQDQKATTGQATVAGGVVGALAGGLLGRRSGNTAVGALAGGGAGAVLGWFVGKNIAGKKADAQRQKYDLIRYYGDAVKANQRAGQRLAGLQQNLNQLEAELKRARAAGDAKKISSLRSQFIRISKDATDQSARLNRSISEQKAIKLEVRSSQNGYRNFVQGIDAMQGSRDTANRISTRAASLAAQIGQG